jgi:3-methyladenine DNA glycosylase AlkC
MRSNHFALTEVTLTAALKENTRPLEQFKKRIPAEMFDALTGNDRCPGLKHMLELISSGQSELTTSNKPDWDMHDARIQWDALNARYGYFSKDKEAFFELFKQAAAPIRTMAVLFEPQHFQRDEMAYDYVYKLMALFVDPADNKTQTLDALAAATENLCKSRDKVTTHPLHDTLLDMKLPALADIDYQDRAGWRAFLKTQGAQALPFLSEAKKIEDKNGGKAPKSLKEAQGLRLLCQYTRASEDIAFATTCRDFKVSEDSFNQSLDLMSRGWPKKTTDFIPSLMIEGKDNAQGYCWVKLPSDDKRALILGRITGCCQSIGDHSDQCVRDAVSLSNNGLYVLLKQKKAGEHGFPLIDGKINDVQFEIVGQSYVWKSCSGNICLDSIECSEGRVPSEALKEIITDFANELLIKNPDIQRVTVGQGGRTPRGLFDPAAISEAMREGHQYGDSMQQCLIAKKHTMSDTQTERLNALLQGKPKEFSACIGYLSEYEDDKNQFIQGLDRLLKESPDVISQLDMKSLSHLFFHDHRPTLDDLRPASIDELKSLPVGTITTARLIFHANTIEKLIDVLPYIRPDERVAAVQEKDDYANPELWRALLSLLPENAQFAALQEKDKYGHTLLIKMVHNPDLLVILPFLPENARLAVLQEKDGYGYTLLDKMAYHPELWLVILPSLIPGLEHLLKESPDVISQLDMKSLGHLFFHDHRPTLDDLRPVSIDELKSLPVGTIPTARLIVHANTIEKLIDVLPYIRPDERVAAVQKKNDYANPELWRALLSLLPENARLAALQEKDKYGHTILSRVISDARGISNILMTILVLLPENDRFVVFKEKSEDGLTMLSHMAHSPELLMEILPLLPQSMLLTVVQERDEGGRTILSRMADDDRLLMAIIPRLPESAQLAAFQEKSEHGRTILFRMATDPELLREISSFLPESVLLAALQVKDKYGETILPSRLLIDILPFLPESTQIALVQMQDERGRTILFRMLSDANFDSDLLIRILLLLPEKAQLAAFQEKSESGQTILFRMALSPESLKDLFPRLPENVRLAALQEKDSYGDTVLSRMAMSPESLKVILPLLPENARLPALQEKDKYGHTILSRFKYNREVLEVIVESLCTSDILILNQDLPRRECIFRVIEDELVKRAVNPELGAGTQGALPPDKQTLQAGLRADITHQYKAAVPKKEEEPDVSEEQATLKKGG